MWRNWVRLFQCTETDVIRCSFWTTWWQMFSIYSCLQDCGFSLPTFTTVSLPVPEPPNHEMFFPQDLAPKSWATHHVFNLIPVCLCPPFLEKCTKIKRSSIRNTFSSGVCTFCSLWVHFPISDFSVQWRQFWGQEISTRTQDPICVHGKWQTLHLGRNWINVFGFVNGLWPITLNYGSSELKLCTFHTLHIDEVSLSPFPLTQSCRLHRSFSVCLCLCVFLPLIQ